MLSRCSTTIVTLAVMPGRICWFGLIERDRHRIVDHAVRHRADEGDFDHLGCKGLARQRVKRHLNGLPHLDARQVRLGDIDLRFEPREVHQDRSAACWPKTAGRPGC